MEFHAIASGSSGNCYRVSDGRTSLLLDAGIPFKEIQKALNFRVRDISGALVTHEHGDHIKGAKDLAKYGVPIYASEGTFNAYGVSGHNFRVVKSLEEFVVGTFKILPFDVEHDVEEPLGFLLESTETGEKLLYFTDTYYIKYRFTGLTIIAGECNYSMDIVKESVEKGYIPQELVPRLIKSHMSLEHFLDVLKANDMSTVRKIYLLHLSNNNSNADMFKEAVQRQTGAEVYVC